MLIKELKEILENFEEDKDVSIFLDLTSNFGIAYEIEDWADNNGHLDLWIRDSPKNLLKEIKSIDKL
jgi:hypothetical protein